MITPHERFDPRQGIAVATDAAVNQVLERVGSGFVATSGLYGVAGHPQPAAVVGPEAVTVAELRAVWRALEALNEDRYPRAEITVLVDSARALSYLAAWKSGRMVFPAGYQLQIQRESGEYSSLEKVADQLRYDGQRYRFIKVRGHAGHHLNEAADTLARLGLRAGSRRGLPSGEVGAVAGPIAAARLGDYWCGSKTAPRADAWQ